jgi:hypothetical protein
MDGFKGIHHGYLGLALILIGFLLVFTSLPFIISLVCVILGILIFADDYWQHYKQKKNPKYQSPLHRFYVWLIRKMFESKYFSWLADFILWLNWLFDKMLGRDDG